MKRVTTGLFAGLALVLATVVSTAQPPKAVPPETSAVARGCNDFAFDLYTRLHARDGNLFLSPYSISDALAMTSLGARGETLAQMAKVLHFPAEGDRLYAAYASLIGRMNAAGEDRPYELHVADALWGQKDYGFRPEFLKRSQQFFGAGLREVDFRNATEEARAAINRWVEQQTQDRIKDLVPQGALQSDTRLVLTNAIYFKAGWAATFPERLTAPAPFTVAPGKKVDVPLMHLTEDFRYLESDKFQLLELPYRKHELSMVVLLPKKGDGLPEVEKQLTEANLTRWLGQLKTHSVEVSLPKFRFTAEFSLAKTLREMGMTSAFSDSADFSGMSNREGLALAQVIHKAFVAVDEKGTEAAGATAIIAKPTSVQDTPRAVFRADHPFVFLIRDRQTGSILFLGRLVSPA